MITIGLSLFIYFDVAKDNIFFGQKCPLGLKYIECNTENKTHIKNKNRMKILFGRYLFRSTIVYWYAVILI